jgi:ADP-heptose:LPS heptosyltransferase
MDLGFQRFVDRYAGVPICAALSLLERLRPARRARAASPEARRVVVILLSEMGSLVLAQPMFARLRERVPQGSLHVMLFAKNREALDLLRIVPEANVIEVDDGSVGALAKTLWHGMRRLWRLRPDVVIDCELFARISSILSYLSNAPLRVGFHRGTQEGLYRGSFINRRVLYNPYQHITKQFLALADAMDSHATPVTKTALVSGPLAPPHLRFDAGEVEDVRRRLHQDFPALAGRSLVLVYPGAGVLPIRGWPLASFLAVCAALRDDGHAVGIIGLPSDHALAESLTGQLASPRCVNLAGYTLTIRHLLSLFSVAQLLVTNDGGPGQFAALTPLPTIVFFGPETPALYGSHAPNAHFMYRGLPCSPCLTAYNHRNSPCDGDNQCLKQITPAEVLARARALLATAGARRDEREEAVAGV